VDRILLRLTVRDTNQMDVWVPAIASSSIPRSRISWFRCLPNRHRRSS